MAVSASFLSNNVLFIAKARGSLVFIKTVFPLGEWMYMPWSLFCISVSAFMFVRSNTLFETNPAHFRGTPISFFCSTTVTLYPFCAR